MNFCSLVPRPHALPQLQCIYCTQAAAHLWHTLIQTPDFSTYFTQAPPLCAQCTQAPPQLLYPTYPGSSLMCPMYPGFSPVCVPNVPGFSPAFVPNVPRLLPGFYAQRTQASPQLLCPMSQASFVAPSTCSTTKLAMYTPFSYLAVSGGLGAQILNLWPLLPPTQGSLGPPALYLVHSLPRQTPTTR